GDPFQPVGAQGFFITHDGGATWTAGGDLGATTFIHTILAIGPSAVLVGGSDGLLRSTDGGHSFSRVVFPASGGGIWSLAVTTTAPCFARAPGPTASNVRPMAA